MLRNHKQPSTPQEYVRSFTRRRAGAPRTPSRSTVLPNMTLKQKDKMSKATFIAWITDCEFILKEERAQADAERSRQPPIAEAMAAAAPSAAGPSSSASPPRAARNKFVTSPTPEFMTAEMMNGHRSSQGIWLRSSPFKPSIA